jgi:hypothetical protein
MCAYAKLSEIIKIMEAIGCFSANDIQQTESCARACVCVCVWGGGGQMLEAVSLISVQRKFRMTCIILSATAD